MADYTEEVEVLLKARGGNEITKEATDISKTWSESLNIIKQEIERFSATRLIGLNEMFNLDSVFNFIDAISDLHVNNIEPLYLALMELEVRVKNLNIDATLKQETLDRFVEYKQILRDVNEEMSRTSSEGEDKTIKFLDRYKYSLVLVGGALGVIMGMMRYSTTFGTALDVLGQAVGYLADVIMYPLLPYIMMLAEWIIGLADWFEGLPDPIKAVVSGLVSLLGVMAILQAFTGLNVFGWLMKSLGNVLLWLDDFIKGLAPRLAAWEAMMAAGGLTGGLAFAAAAGVGLLLGFAGVYVLIQTGVLNMVSKYGDELKKSQPTLMAMLIAWLGPFAMLGGIVIDLVTGQWDQIPYHMELMSKIISESWKVLALNVVKSIHEMAIGIQGFIGSIGELLQKNPLTQGIGKGLTDWSDSQQKKFSDDTNVIEREIDRRNILIKQYNRIITTGSNVDTNESEFMPGSIFRGFSSDDQKRYLEELELLKKMSGPDVIDKITDKFNSGVNNFDVNTATSNLFNVRKSLSELNTEFSNGTMTVDQYQQKINELIQDTSGITNTTQSIQESNRSLTKPKEFFKTDDRDTTSSLSVNEMMASRYEKMMRDYTTQSKYKNDGYLNPLNDSLKQPNEKLKETGTPLDVSVTMKPDIKYIGKDEYWPAFMKYMSPNAPVRVPIQIEPEVVLTKVASREELVQEVLNNLTKDRLIGPNVTDTHFGVSDLNPITKYLANAKAAYNPVIDEVQLDKNAGMKEAYHEILHASTNPEILTKMSEDQKNSLYSQIMNQSQSAWGNRDFYASRPFMDRDKMLDEWLAEMGTRHMTGTGQYQGEIDPKVLGTEIASAIQENNTQYQMYVDLLSELRSSKVGELPNSPAPSGNNTQNNQTITYEISLSPTIQVNGYNKDSKQLVREMGPEMMKWMDEQTRGRRF